MTQHPPCPGFVPRPQLAFRVGITGARQLDEAALPAVRQQMQHVLAALRGWLLGLAAQPDIAALYAPAPVLLRMLSPLAEGADRLAAETALALGYQLEAFLPFAPAAYERDFPETIAPFRALLAAAAPHVLALDGARGDAETRSYEAAGRLVVRNCDLLIAVWDGAKGRGRGGTAEIVHYAARHGLPVWWVPADGQNEAGWLNGPAAARHSGTCPRGAEALALLEAYVRQHILPGPIAPEPRPGLINGLFGLFHRRKPHNPLHGMFAEAPLPRRFIWSLHRRLMRWAGGGTAFARLPAIAPPPGEAWAYWQRFYAPLDQCAVAYAERYRSSYVLIFALAALAACAAILGVGIHPQARISTSFELLFLFGILAIAAVNEFRHWHQRSITYRLLAELFRKQQALALLAWSLPAAEIIAVTGEADGAPVRDILVGWYFNAVQRAAPLPQGAFGDGALARIRAHLRAELIEGQIAYHARRQEGMERAARRFGKLGALFFLLTLATVFIKFLLMWAAFIVPHAGNSGMMDEDSILAGFIAALLPALSAGFVGIRGYAELELLADQSLQMRRVLAQCAARLHHLRLDAPLASQEFGAEILALAEGMLRDIRGWAQLFRVKAVDVG